MMTDDEMRVAIARSQFGEDNYRVQLIARPGPRNYSWYGKDGQFVPTPDYLNDLNAMHEAEKVLTAAQLSTYCHVLRPIVEEQGRGGFAYMFTATARQRAEAFLRTLHPEKFNQGMT